MLTVNFLNDLELYQQAEGSKAKALLALNVAEQILREMTIQETCEWRKFRARAWQWADMAAGRAFQAGVTNFYELLGTSHEPNINCLRASLT